MTTTCGVARMGGCGDNIIVSCVFPGLKKRYDRLEVICQKPWHVVFENNPYVDRVIAKDEGDIPAPSADEWQRWYVNRGKEYDAFFHLSHTCEMQHALFFAQPAFHAPASYRRKLCGGSYLETVADFCEVPHEEIAPGFFPTVEEQVNAHKFATTLRKKTAFDNAAAPDIRFSPIVGWVCCGSRVDKFHPRAGIVIARLIREMNLTVALFGGPGKDLYIAEQIEKQVRHENGDVTGLRLCISKTKESDEWPLRRSLTQLQYCDLVVSPDTGPAWAVAMEALPKVIMVSHASAENITKHWRNTVTLHADPTRVPCHPCHRLHNDKSTCVPSKDDDGAACMADISVAQIFEAVRDGLHRRYTDRPIVLTITNDETNNLLVSDAKIYRHADAVYLSELIGDVEKTHGVDIF